MIFHMEFQQKRNYHNHNKKFHYANPTLYLSIEALPLSIKMKSRATGYKGGGGGGVKSEPGRKRESRKRRGCDHQRAKLPRNTSFLNETTNKFRKYVNKGSDQGKKRQK